MQADEQRIEHLLRATPFRNGWRLLTPHILASVQAPLLQMPLFSCPPRILNPTRRPNSYRNCSRQVIYDKQTAHAVVSHGPRSRETLKQLFPGQTPATVITAVNQELLNLDPACQLRETELPGVLCKVAQVVANLARPGSNGWRLPQIPKILPFYDPLRTARGRGQKANKHQSVFSYHVFIAAQQPESETTRK
eukprot:s3299_g8.t1